VRFFKTVYLSNPGEARMWSYVDDDYKTLIEARRQRSAKSAVESEEVREPRTRHNKSGWFGSCGI